MPEVIDDVALPRGVWTLLAAAAVEELWVTNKGAFPVLLRRAPTVPATDAGAMPLAPGERRGPDAPTAWGLPVWALSPASGGRVAVEARWTVV